MLELLSTQKTWSEKHSCNRYKKRNSEKEAELNWWENQATLRKKTVSQVPKMKISRIWWSSTETNDSVKLKPLIEVDVYAILCSCLPSISFLLSIGVWFLKIAMLSHDSTLSQG